MKTRYTVEQCPLCKQQTKREHFKDNDGRSHSSLVRHLKDGAVCVKGTMTLMDVMQGNQYTGVQNG